MGCSNSARPASRSPALFRRKHAVLALVSQGYPPLLGAFPCITHPSATRRQGCKHPRAAVRLACVKRAASVQSEPGSNSSVEKNDFGVFLNCYPDTPPLRTKTTGMRGQCPAPQDFGRRFCVQAGARSYWLCCKFSKIARPRNHRSGTAGMRIIHQIPFFCPIRKNIFRRVLPFSPAETARSSDSSDSFKPRRIPPNFLRSSDRFPCGCRRASPRMQTAENRRCDRHAADPEHGV